MKKIKDLIKCDYDIDIKGITVTIEGHFIFPDACISIPNG